MFLWDEKKNKKQRKIPWCLDRLPFLQQDSGIWDSLSTYTYYAPNSANISGTFFCSPIPQSLKYIPNGKEISIFGLWTECF